MHRLSIALLMLAGACQRAAEPGRNPHPIHLVRPAMAPLSAVALAGRQLFFDTTLSASGHASCATCHNPAAAYAAPNALAVQPGGADGRGTGIRAVPSLRYTDRTPEFFIGPDDGVAENVNVTQLALQNAGTTRAPKTVGSTASATAMVPRGGLFWDGRVNTLQDQAMGPLFNVAEMANHRVADAAARIRATPAAAVLVQLFGAAILHSPARLVDEAMFAIARFEVEDPSFHPYTSRYDRYLEGTATLTATELRGLAAFEDTARGNCAGCHLDKAGRDG
ncbi:MAG TPA: cytochrome c peroxidase, partial [Gemmatimonadales bacterium]|nr:cytochrome c peroxidase [Gemmatimonadales bacterium]